MSYRLDPDCPICQHADREAIDAALAEIANHSAPYGAAYLVAAKRLGVDQYDLGKHERYHRDQRN